MHVHHRPLRRSPAPAAAILLALLCLLLLAGPASADLQTGDGGWTWQNPLPSGATINDLWFTSATHGWAATATGAIIATTDGGETWAWKGFGVDPCTHVAFADDSHGWVSCSSGYVLRTTDGGATWSQSSLGAGTNVQDISCTDASHVWVSGYIYDSATESMISTIYRSTDGGITWQGADISALGTAGSLAFVDSLHGWVTADRKVLATSDGGATWTATALEATDSLAAVSFPDAQHGWIATLNTGKIYCTTDGGATWTEQTSGTSSGFRSIAFIDNQKGWAATDSTILRTVDGGSTWTESTSCAESQGWTSLATLPGGGCYAAGSSGAAAQTTDGDTWTPVYQELSAFTAPAFISAFDRLACVQTVGATDVWVAITHWTEATGGLVHSIDGGATWTTCDVTLPGWPRDMAFVDAQHGWIACGDYVARTTDGGSTWQTQSVCGSTVAAISFVDAQHGWCVASRYVWVTSDGGQTWTQQKEFDSETTGNDVQFLDLSHGWALHGNYVLSTVDGGQNWTSSAAWDEGLRELSMATLSQGWAVGDGGMILRTVDGGATWTQQDSGCSCERDDISCSSGSVAWASGDLGVLLHTTDGGITWSEQNPGTDDSIADISFTDATHGFAIGGQSRAILATSTGGVSPLVTPKTTSSLGSCWKNKTTSLTFTATDQTGGQGVREVRCTNSQSGEGRMVVGATASAKVVADTTNHTLDGVYPIRFFAVGKNSGVEPTRTVTIGIDTRKPLVSGLKSLKVYKGRTLKVSYRLQDPTPCKGTVKVVITVKNRSGKVVKVVNGGVKTAVGDDGYAVPCTTKFVCSLAKGTYRYTLKATDPATNSTTSKAYYLQVF